MPISMAFIVTVPIVPIAIGIGLLFSESANAQIIYTDVIPDSTLYCQCQVQNCFVTKSYTLDLNNDANNDFILTANLMSFNAISNGSVSIVPQVNNTFITTSLNTVKKLVLGDTISSSQAWHDTTFQYLKKWNYLPGNPPILKDTGEWDTVVDGYIGLQLIHAGQTYYGWLRINVDVTYSSASFTIKDYAYNSIPNQPILAGQTITTGIFENSFASSINLFPNPATNHLTIALPNANEKVEIIITDITGKIIYTITATDPDSPGSYRDLEQKIEVNTKDFAEGVYVVQIHVANLITTKKLVIKK